MTIPDRHPTVHGTCIGESNEKRFYLPGIRIEDTCPSCGKDAREDFSREYLFYPSFGVPQILNMYCGHCDHEWELKYKLDLSMEIIHE